MNLRQWRKAYMLEFLKNDNEVEDVFTFSMPPESESLEFPQRITETPTLGGVVFDDYGNDTVKIRLAGSTINEERKLIYRGNKKLPEYLTGEKEIFRLQELLNKWGNIDYEYFPSKKIYLYDLSKMNLLQIGAGSPAESPTRNFWRIVNKGLKIKRAEDKPLTYKYELEMVGIVDESHKPQPLFSEGFGAILDSVQKVVSIIEKVAEVTEEIADAVDTLTQQIVDVKKFAEKLQNGDARHNTEAIMRKFPGGNNLWNATRAVMGTASKIQYLAGTTTSHGGSTNYLKEDSFMVSFNSGSGPYVASVKAAYGNYAVKPPDPVLDKFNFMGWYTEPEGGAPFEFNTTEITKNITLYAKWGQIQATVAFNSRGGSAVLPVTLNIGQAAVAPQPPIRQGYTFEYWCTDSSATVEYDFSTPVTGDRTLYAKWQTVYTITFNSNGGTAVPVQIVDIGNKIIYPLIPKRENYLFGMWCIDSTLNTEFNFDTPINGNIVLYAKWTRISNTITFNSNGGTAVPVQIVDIGSHAVRPPDPVKDGHVFQRWCSDEGLAQEFFFNNVSVNYPMTLYAKWLTKNFTVHFESNGGTVIPDQLVNFRALAIYPPVPDKAGALFLRWSNDAGLENEFNFSTPITENTILYAKWHEGAGA
jgi:uncharacterized repeat protein (TIGR02543 family)